MSNSNSNCKICFKLYTLNENGQDQSEEYREKLLKVSSEHLFSELCDWSNISSKEPLPFCSECTQGIENLSIRNDKYNKHEKDISDFSEQFSFRGLRSRKSRRETGFKPEVLGDVTVKGEKGIDGDEFLRYCKICHEMYKTQNQVLDFAETDNIIGNCEKYLFPEIFDSGSLNVNSIMTLKFFPFCSKCCEGIKELCVKNDLKESTLENISKFAQEFTFKVLNGRKHRKSFEYSGSENIRNDIDVPSNNSPVLENSITVPVKENVVEPPVQDETDDDDCMIVDVIICIPFGRKKNDVNSHCNNKVTENHENNIKPQASSPVVPNTTGDVNDSSEIWPSVVEVKSEFAAGFPGSSESPPILSPNHNINIEPDDSSPLMAFEDLDDAPEQLSSITGVMNESAPGLLGTSENPPTLSPIVISTSTMNYANTEALAQGSSLGSSGSMESTCFSDAFPGPSSGRKRRRREINGAFKCQNCGKTFKCNLNWHNHVDSCLNAEIYQELDEQTTSDSDVTVKTRRRRWLRQKRSRTSRRQKRVNPFSAGAGSGRCSHFICKMCPMTFKAKDLYSDHLQTHYDIVDDNIRCDICRKVFSSTFCRRRHFENQHPSVAIERVAETGIQQKQSNPRQRPKIGKRVKKRPRNVDQTYRPPGIPSRSEKILGYTCPMCQTVFSERKELSKHRRIHYDIAINRCTICKIVFNTIRPLKMHMAKVHRMEFLIVGSRSVPQTLWSTINKPL